LRLSSIVRLLLATALLLPAIGLVFMAVIVMSYSWQGEHDLEPVVYVVAGLIYLAVAFVLAGSALVAMRGLRRWQGLMVLAVVSTALAFVPYESLFGLGIATNASAAVVAVAFWMALFRSIRRNRRLAAQR